MLEVNAVYFILLAEGFALTVLLLLSWIVLSIYRRRRKRRDLKRLVERIQQRAGDRNERNSIFVQAVYHLESDELVAAVANIEKHENTYFGKLIDCLDQGNTAQLENIDLALEELMTSYKCLQPRTIDEAEESVVQELETARLENQVLREDLSAVSNQMSHLIAEFGDIFGGGQDNQLSLDEIMEHISKGKQAAKTDVPKQA